MDDARWIEGFPGGITVCDADGVIVAMNARAAETFAGEGGRALVGRRLVDCHPDRARPKVEALLAGGRVNAYTIRKGGARKLIYQAPWRAADGSHGGLVEISLAIPDEMPHFDRGG